MYLLVIILLIFVILIYKLIFHMTHRVLKNNQLNGTLDIGTAISNQLELLDLQTNFIEEFNPKIDVSKVDIM